MIKLPEPVAWLCNWDGHFAAMTNKPEPVNAYKSVEPLVKEAQLKQAVRDVLTLTIQRLNGDTYNLTKAECVEEIRALIKELKNV